MRGFLPTVHILRADWIVFRKLRVVGATTEKRLLGSNHRGPERMTVREGGQIFTDISNDTDKVFFT